MSASSRLELRVGMLIVAGLAAIVILILVSDRISFDDTYRVTAYLDSAAGLNNGTPVTLSGIRIGKIQSIRSISDKRGSVQVEMSINERYRLPVDARLHVASNGIFGDSFLEFTGSGARTTATLPIDGSAEVIASPGFFDKATDQALHIMEAVNDLLTAQTRGDAKRLVANAADLAQESAALVRDLRAKTGGIPSAIASLEDLTKELRSTSHDIGVRVGHSLDAFDSAIGDVDKQVDAVSDRAQAVAGVAVETMSRLGSAADETAGTLHDNRAQVRETLSALADVSRRTAELVDGLRAGHGVIGQLLVNNELARDVNDIAINLSVASETISDHPEALVFGTSTQQLAALQARRERMRLRRAFSEGYYRTPPVQVVEPLQVGLSPPRAPAQVER